MWIFVEPLDVLMFRDSKLFTAGEGFWARSVFPPNGMPLMGAIRAKIMADNGIGFRDYRNYVKRDAQTNSPTHTRLKEVARLIGTPNDYGELELKGVFLCRQKEGGDFESYFPAPLDVILNENKDVNYLKPRQFSWNVSTSLATLTGSSDGFSALPFWTEDFGDLPENMFLESHGLLNYLKNVDFSTQDKSEFWGSEFQVGIEKGETGTAEIGKIYSIEFVRLKEEADWKFFRSGFLIEINDVEKVAFESEGLLALGGESRAARYEGIEGERLDKLNELIAGNFLLNKLAGKKTFKIYLATPAIFANGWYPDFLEFQNADLAGERNGIKFKLISAVVNKPASVSGWDIVNNKPRPMLKAVPAGSVYHFELADDETFDETKINALREAFHFKSLTGLGNEDLSGYSKVGFGLAFVGCSTREA